MDKISIWLERSALKRTLMKQQLETLERCKISLISEVRGFFGDKLTDELIKTDISDSKVAFANEESSL